MALKSDAIFDKIKVRVGKITEAERKVEHVYKFNIKGSDGNIVKSWILDLKNVKLFVGGDNDVAECTLTISDDDMVLLGSGALVPKDALAQDKLDVDGDISLALKLEPFISSL